MKRVQRCLALSLLWAICSSAQAQAVPELSPPDPNPPRVPGGLTPDRTPRPAGFGQERERSAAEPAKEPTRESTPPPTAGSAGAAISLSEDDRTLVEEAAQIGMSEIKAAEIALERSRDSSVMKLAQALLGDHRKSHEQLLDIAQRALVSVGTLDATRMHMITELEETPLTGFDRVYVRTVVRGHMDAQSSLGRILTHGQDQALRLYARNAATMVQKHMDAAKALEAKQVEAAPDVVGRR